MLIRPRGGGIDDNGHAGLQVVTLGPHGGFLSVHAAHFAAIGLEDLDGRGHFADLVLAPKVGNCRIQISVGHLAHDLGYPADRRTQLTRSDIEAESSSRPHAGDSHRDNHPEYGSAESVDPRLDDFKLGNVVFHDTVDLRLIGLAISAVCFVVALLARRLRPAFLSQPDGLQAESPEFLRAAGKLVETSLLFRRHERCPAGNELVHGVEVLDHAVGKGCGRSNVRRCIDATRLHDDCRYQTVERFALVSPFGRLLEMVRPNPEFVDRIDGQPADGTGNKAHQPDK